MEMRGGSLHSMLLCRSLKNQSRNLSAQGDGPCLDKEHTEARLNTTGYPKVWFNLLNNYIVGFATVRSR